jgi:hypothetical protein
MTQYQKNDEKSLKPAFLFSSFFSYEGLAKKPKPANGSTLGFV